MKTTKKLQLNKESLRILKPSEELFVAGAGTCNCPLGITISGAFTCAISCPPLTQK